MLPENANTEVLLPWSALQIQIFYKLFQISVRIFNLSLFTTIDKKGIELPVF